MFNKTPIHKKLHNKTCIVHSKKTVKIVKYKKSSNNTGKYMVYIIGIPSLNKNAINLTFITF